MNGQFEEATQSATRLAKEVLAYDSNGEGLREGDRVRLISTGDTGVLIGGDGYEIVTVRWDGLNGLPESDARSIVLRRER